MNHTSYRHVSIACLVIRDGLRFMRDQVRDRKRWLDMARVTRSRALLWRCVRRVLTFGLWRN